MAEEFFNVTVKRFSVFEEKDSTQVAVIDPVNGAVMQTESLSLITTLIGYASATGYSTIDSHESAVTTYLPDTPFVVGIFGREIL